MQEAQNRLELYRDRYIDLYDFAPLGYVTLDEDGFVQEINLAGAQLLNLEREAVTGYPFSEYVIKEDVPVFREMVRRCVGEHRDATCELRLMAGDGSSITVQLRSVPIDVAIEGIGGEATFCKTAITDISDRKQMEEAIRQSRAFLQTVIDAMPEAMLVIGRDYRIVLANRAARILGGGADIASSCPPCYQVAPQKAASGEAACDPCPLRQTIESKVPVSVIHTRRDEQGASRTSRSAPAPVFDEKGEVSHIVETCRDVTVQKREKEALACDRNLLRTLIDDLPDCIYVKDAAGRFIAANVATARIMGRRRARRPAGKDRLRLLPARVGRAVPGRRRGTVAIGQAASEQGRAAPRFGRRCTDRAHHESTHAER